jgi:hypothetical protein
VNITGDEAVYQIITVQNLASLAAQKLQPMRYSTGAGAGTTAAGGTKILGMDAQLLALCLGITAYGGGKGLEENKEAAKTL